MRPVRSTDLLAALLGVAALALAPAPAWAGSHEEAHDDAAPGDTPRKAWDQERMTDLSAQLTKAMSEVRQAFRREPSFRDPNNPNRRASQNMDQTLRALETSARQLHARVQGGGGYQETLGIARKIGTQLNDAQVEGRKIMTSHWMDERIRPAMALINEIAPYYGSGPLFDPEAMKRID
jgi:hypothetical protein